MTDILDRLRTKRYLGGDLTMESIDAERAEAADEISRLQKAKRRALDIADERSKENVALRRALRDIAEFCSGDDQTLGAIKRLIHIRNTAQQALRHSDHQ